MQILLDKRDAILADINSVNDRMRALEKEHGERIIQLHELRGAQRVVDSLIDESEHLILAEQRAAELEKQFKIEEMEQLKSQAILPGLEELSEYNKEKVLATEPAVQEQQPSAAPESENKFSVGDRVKVANMDEWMSGHGVEVGDEATVLEDGDQLCLRLSHLGGKWRNVFFDYTQLEQLNV